MAKKRTGGSTKNGRDSSFPSYLRVICYGGAKVFPGNIVLTQRGSNFHAGENVGTGRDYTLFALKEGIVKFSKTKKSGIVKKKIVSIH